MNASGSPLSGGKIFTYAAGSVTPVATYTDSTGTTPQTNPIILNSRGVPDSPIWLTGGQSYRFVLQDSAGVTLSPTFDNVSGINDPATVTTQDEWVALGATPTFVSATSFSVPGDRTPSLQVSRRLKTVNAGGVVYSTILTSSFGGGLTTVTVSNDSGTLDAGLSTVSYGLLAATNPSIPTNIHGRLIGVQVFTANGTYTPTTGTASVVVEVQAGGGGGGGTAVTVAAQQAAGGGGAAGGYAKSRITSSFSGVAVTVGAGGTTSAGANGGAGGTSSFGALAAAAGGSGGFNGTAAASTANAFAQGGAGGAGSSGNVLTANGQPGGWSMYTTAGSAISGVGGASFFGGGGTPVTNAAGVAAASPGAGGSGAAVGANTAAQAGGAGAAGRVIVWEYA